MKARIGRMQVIHYLLPWPFHRDLPPCPDGKKRKLTLADLVLSVLPWPFHKDLPDPGSCEAGCDDSGS